MLPLGIKVQCASIVAGSQCILPWPPSLLSLLPLHMLRVFLAPPIKLLALESFNQGLTLGEPKDKEIERHEKHSLQSPFCGHTIETTFPRPSFPSCPDSSLVSADFQLIHLGKSNATKNDCHPSESHLIQIQCRQI